MKRNLFGVLYFAIFGLLATGASVVFVPTFFEGTGIATYILYGLVMAFSMFAGNMLELRAWATPFASARANSQVWRLIIRMGIYLLVPTLLIYVLSFTGAFVLAHGFLTAFALTWMPLAIGAWLNYFPANKRWEKR